jgi:hypothetical protein
MRFRAQPEFLRPVKYDSMSPLSDSRADLNTAVSETIDSGSALATDTVLLTTVHCQLSTVHCKKTIDLNANSLYIDYCHP